MFLMTQTLSKLNIKPMCLYVIKFLKVKKKRITGSKVAFSCCTVLPLRPSIGTLEEGETDLLT